MARQPIGKPVPPFSVPATVGIAIPGGNRDRQFLDGVQDRSGESVADSRDPGKGGDLRGPERLEAREPVVVERSRLHLPDTGDASEQLDDRVSRGLGGLSPTLGRVFRSAYGALERLIELPAAYRARGRARLAPLARHSVAPLRTTADRV